MKVLEVVNETRGKVVWDAIDEDLVSGWVSMWFEQILVVVVLGSYPRSTILT